MNPRARRAANRSAYARSFSAAVAHGAGDGIRRTLISPASVVVYSKSQPS